MADSLLKGRQPQVSIARNTTPREISAAFQNFGTASSTPCLLAVIPPGVGLPPAYNRLVNSDTTSGMAGQALTAAASHSTGRTLAGLNPRQREAAAYVSSPLLIVAGPGSGKTRVMAHRVAYLIGHEGVAPWRILAVTFTNKAARELRERCERLVGGEEVESHPSPQPSPARGEGVKGELSPAERGGDERGGRRRIALQVFTFHGFCARVLRQDGERVGLKSGFTIYDDDDQERVMKRVLEDLDADKKQFPPIGVLHAISDAKNRMLGPEQVIARVQSYRDEVIARAYPRYEAALAKANAADFDDLLLKVFHLFQGHPDALARFQDRYQHLLVDEFQDTNPLQFEVARMLAARHRNICVVGDPDQSIYSWRHADPTNLHEFLRVFPDAKVVTLDQSYRSTQTILSAADAVITNNAGRLDKKLWTENPQGAQVALAEAYDEDEEARLVLDEVDRLVAKDGINPRDVAVMYRINAQSRALEVACNRRGLPYRLVGGLKFYDRAEVKDVLAYLRMASNPADDSAVERIINTPPRGISERTVSELRRAAIAPNVPLLDMVFSLQERGGQASPVLQPRAAGAVAAFADLAKRLIEQSMTLQPADLIDLVLDRSGYLQSLRDDEDRGDERTENVRELRGTAELFAFDQPGADPRQALAAFLENVALVSDVDLMDSPVRANSPSYGEGQSAGERANWAPRQARGDAQAPITFITLHQAKGLEFDAVFIIGMEEGLLPHSRSLESEQDLQEERRICYVGMTRARRRLYLLHAFQRSFRGSRMPSAPSRFLAEIPPALLSVRSIRNTGRRANLVPDPMAVKRAAEVPAARVMSRPKLALSPGDRVRHELFGDGVVVSAKEVRGDTEVTVAFAGKGVKRLMLAFAPLERVSSPKGAGPHGGPKPTGPSGNGSPRLPSPCQGEDQGSPRT